MARAPKVQTTAVVNWETEMERQAQLAAGMEAHTTSGAFFSIRSGQLSSPDGLQIPGNTMAVIIVDAILENVLYENKFDPDNPSPPTCFAFSHEDATLAPHETVVEAGQAQHETCRGCRHNEWGTADTGRGKACRNVRRLALISAGTIDVSTGRFTPERDPEHYEKAQVGYFKVPVTSVRGYAAYIKTVAGALRRPPHGVITRVRVVPDPKTQIRVLFEPLEPVPDGLIGTVMRRHDEARASIEFPYDLTSREAPEPRPNTRQRRAKY